MILEEQHKNIRGDKRYTHASRNNEKVASERGSPGRSSRKFPVERFSPRASRPLT